eukprot:1160982-Pelagomonas_calceolata.AAC.3
MMPAQWKSRIDDAGQGCLLPFCLGRKMKRKGKNYVGSEHYPHQLEKGEVRLHRFINQGKVRSGYFAISVYKGICKNTEPCKERKGVT